jgi:hypothetical protein
VGARSSRWLGRKEQLVVLVFVRMAQGVVYEGLVVCVMALVAVSDKKHCEP